MIEATAVIAPAKDAVEVEMIAAGIEVEAEAVAATEASSVAATTIRKINVSKRDFDYIHKVIIYIIFF